MHHIHLDSVDSTNTYLAANCVSLPSGTLVTAGTQTAGRGQRGNSWESEPGKNITFSYLYKPEAFPALCQFAISEALALAIVDTLSCHTGEVSVKWPNDIYAGDRKICGILIEHAVMGTGIMHSILGAGVNINQAAFTSDAPNPVSLLQLTGETHDLSKLLCDIMQRLEANLLTASSESGRAMLHSRYMHNLWRGDGKLYPFTDTATAETFMARISDISPIGMLTLETAAGSMRTYAFKQVSFVIS